MHGGTDVRGTTSSLISHTASVLHAYGTSPVPSPPVLKQRLSLRASTLKNSLIFDPALSDEELRGFSRTVAEIEWLTVILVLLYQVVFTPAPEDASSIAVGTISFAGFVLSFHYFHFYRKESNWKLAIETWVMIGYITWVLLHTGRLESPLINLYLLVVITSALTLGKAATLMQMLLIGACYMWLGDPFRADAPPLHFASLATLVAPMILVAYVTTMLSSDIRRALSQVRDLSQTDELTGVLNMRAFNQIAGRLSQQAARHGRVYTVAIFDSDSLRSVNDEFGREAANRLLKSIVQGIQAEIRETDLIARYGGEKFIVLLQETNAQGAENLAERIRQWVETAVLSTPGKPVTTTVSVGIASYPEHATDLKVVMEHADKALHISKSSGKNRVTVARTAAYIAAAASYLR
jgi:diguanylate cyclase (GGDEF)-like protein